MKTNELTGAALDWAVAKCEDWLKLEIIVERKRVYINVESATGGHDGYSPSSDWSQGGPIIEQEGISVECSNKIDSTEKEFYAYVKYHWQEHCDHVVDGPTPLISAMRCYVASKLGDEVEIPEELV